MYHYGLIGNCQSAALVSRTGSVDWLCFPRPDSAPVFGKILDPQGGSFSIECQTGPIDGVQQYLPNTNILVTRFCLADGSAYQITDYMPRFLGPRGTTHKPLMLRRIVEPVQGAPSIKIVCKPVGGWDKNELPLELDGSSFYFRGGPEPLRLTTNLPPKALLDEAFHTLKEPIWFSLDWNPSDEPPDGLRIRRSLERTTDYWNTWVKHCSIPTLYQSQTIRSALTLKLHCYEDTGAILAALTSSLPEEPNGTRNWDYRFCWLRDAYFFLSAFRNLGHFEETEGFIKFLLGIAQSDDFQRLRPVYRLDGTLPLPELEHSDWVGWANGRPVRSGNQAAEHTQNDVYGEMILMLAPIFLDDRFRSLRTPQHEVLLGQLAALCEKNISQPDAGLWEVRAGWQEHSFSNLMCWAGLDRTQRIQQMGHLQGLATRLPEAIKKAERALANATVDGAVCNGPHDPTLDASLLLLPILNYPDQPLCLKTVDRIWNELRFDHGPGPSAFLYRYLRQDDFGVPKSPFLICSFWLVQALARTGRREPACRVMETVLESANSLGLFAEHYLPQDGSQWGNFPQAYSHVGLINAAFAISPEWDRFL